MRSAWPKASVTNVALRTFAGLWFVGALAVVLLSAVMLAETNPRLFLWKFMFSSIALPSLLAIWFSVRYLMHTDVWIWTPNSGYRGWPYLAMGVLIILIAVFVLDRDGVSPYVLMASAAIVGVTFFVEHRSSQNWNWGLFFIAAGLHVALILLAVSIGFVILKSEGSLSRDQWLGLAALFANNVFLNVYWHALFSKYGTASE